MTTNMDSNGQPNGGTAGQAAPSEGTANNSAVDISAALKRMEDRLEAIERGAQSVKDKRIANLQGEQDNFRAQLAELRDLMAGGLSEAAALRVMSVSQQPAAPIQSQAQPAGNPAASGGGIDVTTVMRAMRLDANDPEVIATLRDERDNVKLIGKLSAIAERKAQPGAPIPDAQIMPTPGTPAQATTTDSIAAELDRLMANPSQNMPRIKELRRQLQGMQ